MRAHYSTIFTVYMLDPRLYSISKKIELGEGPSGQIEKKLEWNFFNDFFSL